MAWNEITWLRTGILKGCCEYGNENSDLQSTGIFLVNSENYLLVNAVSAACAFTFITMRLGS